MLSRSQRLLDVGDRDLVPGELLLGDAHPEQYTLVVRLGAVVVQLRRSCHAVGGGLRGDGYVRLLARRVLRLLPSLPPAVERDTATDQRRACEQAEADWVR